METYHIHINGIVQGVGFRPMVFQLASAMGINGYVMNGNNGVHVFFNASEADAHKLFHDIKHHAPAQAKIISASLQKTTDKTFEGFAVLMDDNSGGKKQVLLPPDIATCSTCSQELHDETNRRYRYPFITCTQCGPRYSIIKTLPYERHGTAMHSFDMCQNCSGEYEDIGDRRFFSQTNSCSICGIQLTIWGSAAIKISNDTSNVLLRIKSYLSAGNIVAVKGIGGYLLLCDAAMPGTIELLRKRKHRRSKPFAVLYHGINEVDKYYEVNDCEKKLLQGKEAPIVLLRPKKDIAVNICLTQVAPGLNKIGVMLPYSPLLDIISGDYGKPLIATSANISGSPIIYKDADALEYLFNIADYVVSYNREIAVPQDDSVVQVSRNSQQPLIIRRSRGYAPSLLQYAPRTNECILATGAFLKSSFTLSVNGNVFVSQFLGSGESYESQQMYRNTQEHLLGLYSVKPTTIVTDKHHGYFSHRYAVEFSQKDGCAIQFVQHHEAHFAAVLAENNLLHTSHAVLGIIWDGTGLGNDGNIWGGEFFVYQHSEMVRHSHFDYFPTITADKMAQQPRISAICTTSGTVMGNAILKEKFMSIEWNNYQKLICKATLFSSSVGRIFDAVASILNLGDMQEYEGEAAMYLQVLAEEYVAANGFIMDGHYFEGANCDSNIPTAYLMQGILEDSKNGKAKPYIAAKLHYSLVCLVDIVARQVNTDMICFSGGVFQNTLLVDWIRQLYDDKYRLFFHKNLSPNDENISFGQLVYYENKIQSKINNSKEMSNRQVERVLTD